MKTPLAWRNIQHNRARSLAAISGVSFAIVLIFMQLGFYASAKTTATLIYDALDFDIIVVSPSYSFVARPGNFARRRLEQAKALPGVAAAESLWIGYGDWRNLETRLRWGTVVLAVDPTESPFRDPILNARLRGLTQPDTALFDALTRPEFGDLAPGYRSEMNGHRLRLLGDYLVGTGFVAGGAVLVSDRTFRDLQPAASKTIVNVGLVRLQPGADAPSVAAALNAMLAPDARAWTRREFSAREQSFWLNTKPIGIMFTSGLFVAFVIGAVILYQVLASEVQNRIREYATLKSLGYTERYIYGVVFRQAVFFALLGFVPAALWATLIYHLLRVHARLPVEMEWSRTAAVAALTAGMCLFAAALAVRQLRRADPADLF